MTESLVFERVFTGRELFAPGRVEIRGPKIVAVGPLPPEAETEPTKIESGTAVPGFVDVHCHGGAGVAFGDPDQDRLARLCAFHRAHGTTSVIASLLTDSVERLETQITALGELVAGGELPGIHLEGPWLAEGRRGAHPARHLRPPTAEDVGRLMDLGDGSVRMVTVAPELPGGLDAIRRIVAAGGVAAVGHTEAGYDLTMAAIEAGARGATHLFNAMPGLGHRDPGPVLALLSDERVWLELILDRVHVDPRLVAWVMRQNPSRAALITDAMAAAGEPDGEYMLGGLPVDVRAGVARLRGSDTIAGSTLTLDVAVANAVAAGVDWQQAVRAATSIPATYLGLGDVGELAPGKAANLVKLGDDFSVRGVMVNGRWVNSEAGS